MKRKAFAILLFTTLISTIFTSCNKDESENWNDGFITEELLKIPYLAKDSIHCYELWKVSDVNRLEFSKSRRGTGNLIWQNEFKIIDPITVDQGYGNTTIISDFYFRGFIDNDNYLCFLLAGALYHTVLSIYNLDGIFLFNHTVNVSSKTLPAGISRWTDGMLIISMEDKTYFMLDKNAKIEKEGVLPDGINLNDILFIDSNRFISSSENIIRYCENIDSPSIKIADLRSYYDGRYPNEINKPQLSIILESVNDNLVLVKTSLVFYSGEKVNEILRINIKTGDVDVI